VLAALEGLGFKCWRAIELAATELACANTQLVFVCYQLACANTQLVFVCYQLACANTQLVFTTSLLVQTRRLYLSTAMQLLLPSGPGSLPHPTQVPSALNPPTFLEPNA
jgi:hypothetical protein